MSVSSKPNTVFWIVGGLFLIWNIIGCYLYVQDVTMSHTIYAEKWGDAMAAARPQYPVWSVAAYAIAVSVGLAAAVMLLMRKKLAFILFVVSLIAAVISFIWGFTNAEYKAAAGSAFMVMPIVVILIGAAQISWTKKQIANGVVI